MSQTVAGILVETLEEIGVRHIFGLIADSLNPIGDVVRQSKIWAAPAIMMASTIPPWRSLWGTRSGSQ